MRRRGVVVDGYGTRRAFLFSGEAPSGFDASEKFPSSRDDGSGRCELSHYMQDGTPVYRLTDRVFMTTEIMLARLNRASKLGADDVVVGV